MDKNRGGEEISKLHSLVESIPRSGERNVQDEFTRSGREVLQPRQVYHRVSGVDFVFLFSRLNFKTMDIYVNVVCKK